MDGVNFYTDRAGTIADPELERRNIDSRRTLTEYLGVLSTAVDRAEAKQAVGLQCAAHLMETWARSAALLERPAVATAQVERVLTAVSLNILARKLSEAGFPPTPDVVSWLRLLTNAVMMDYSRDALKNTIYYRNNAYFWAGVAAGSFALVERDPRMVEFHDQAWKDALATIRDDGFLGAELARGRRALVYHLLSFSALLLMQDIRRALSLPVIAADEERLSRLSGAIGRTLCDGASMPRESSGELERPGEWGFRVTTAFGEGLLGVDWQRCGMFPHNLTDVRIGGDLRRTREAIKASRRP